MTELLQQLALVVLLYMTCFFIASLVLKDASIVDIAWGLGFILLAFSSIILRGNHVVLSLITFLVCIWGIRLSGYILLRKLRAPGEDFRYAKWRRDWGSSFIWRSFLQVFFLQGVIMLIIALPIITTAEVGYSSVTTLSLVGTMVWVMGFLFEAIGDKQLANFKKSKENKGKIMTTGLWKYTRHPNYFGESMQWWGVWIVALSASSPLWTVVSPLLLTYFLLYVSGVPMLERKYAKNAEFQQYAAVTSKFFPWFPRT